jgi:hypothetical protein
MLNKNAQANWFRLDIFCFQFSTRESKGRRYDSAGFLRPSLHQQRAHIGENMTVTIKKQVCEPLRGLQAGV